MKDLDTGDPQNGPLAYPKKPAGQLGRHAAGSPGKGNLADCAGIAESWNAAMEGIRAIHGRAAAI